MHQQVNLYIDLKENAKVDLATAARAALAFDAALKELASAINPMVNVRVELESGTVGSLSLNSLLSAVGLEKKELKAVALAAATFFMLESATWGYAKVLDWIFETPEIHQNLSQEEVEALATEITRILSSRAGEREIGKIYQELQRDDAVKGVGMTTQKGARPSVVVPRSEFSKRGRVVQESEIAGTRTTSAVKTLTLISPVLMQSTRKWKFRFGKTEIGASIKDQQFLTRLLSGREPVAMGDGITMKVLLTTVEERKDGVWQIKKHIVDEVIEVNPAPEQYDLMGSTPED